MDSYKALTHLELGNIKGAIATAKKALKNFEPLSETPFKAFSLETYDKIITWANSNSLR